MKEYIVRIPEAEIEMISQVLKKFGAEINPSPISKRKKVAKKKITMKEEGEKRKQKIDHTYLFGKWKNFDIDPVKLREKSW
jgi:hypothetical protein